MQLHRQRWSLPTKGCSTNGRRRYWYSDSFFIKGQRLVTTLKQNPPLETSSRPALSPTNVLSKGYLLRMPKTLHASHVRRWAEWNFQFSSEKGMLLTFHSLFDKQYKTYGKPYQSSKKIKMIPDDCRTDTFQFHPLAILLLTQSSVTRQCQVWLRP
jgi:hypothetical protein